MTADMTDPSTPTRPNSRNSASSRTAGGTRKRIPAAARDQSAAPRLDRRHRAARRASACSTSAAAAASWPKRWRAAAPRCSASTWPTRRCKVAQLHALEAARRGVDYREVSAEALAAELPGSFDVVTCMEMLEHVPDPGVDRRGLRRAREARRLGVLLDDQPQPQGLPVRDRRRRIRAEPAAARHARIPASSSGPSELAALLPRRRPRRCADARHGIQPADAPLLAVGRHAASTTWSPRRKPPDVRRRRARRCCSISTAR